MEERRHFLSICSVIGIVGVWAGAANVEKTMPDVAVLARTIMNTYLVAVMMALALLLAWPKPWRRSWQSEAMTFVSALALNVAIIWGPTASHVDTVFTQSVSLIGAVMYTSVAARLRFYWALTSAVLSFAGYAIWVKGYTPLQALIVSSNIKLLALSFSFVLVANYAIEYNERRNWVLRKLQEKRRHALEDSTQQLHRLSTQDPLTGLFNRRQFDAELAIMWSRATFAKQPLAMLMLDVDFFKRYNDSYGHIEGDACLIQVAKVVSEIAQAHDGMAARLGGEEFAMLLPDKSAEQARWVAERLCQRVRDAGIAHRASVVSDCVTVSVGAAQAWPGRTRVPHALVTASDQALYMAKEGGRDRAALSLALCDQPHGAQDDLVEGAEGGDVAADLSEADTSLSALPQASEAPEAAYVRTLEGKFRWLRFPAQQEREYRWHNAEERRQHLGVMSVLGLVIYNVYVLINRDMFPDIGNSVLMMQIGLSALLLAMTLLAYRIKSTPWLREGGFSFGTSVLAVVSAWMLSQSHQMTAFSYCISLGLIPMFSGVGARQAFWFTCVPALITVAAVCALLKPADAQQTLVFSQSVFNIVNMTVYTLILAYTLDYGARKAWLLGHIERIQSTALQAATLRLQHLSTVDPLTNLSNRRQYEADLQRLWQAALASQQPVGMLIIDVDYFKLYNDGYGHPEGDRCLMAVAAAVSQAAGQSGGQTGGEQRAMVARLGGEEFGVLLPDASLDDMWQLGERVRVAVRHADIGHRHSKVARHVTVSVGAASVVPAVDMSPHRLMSDADEALYRAKALGRDRVVAHVAEVLPEPV